MENRNKYINPFIAQRADPYVVKAADGSYYFTASVPAFDAIVLRHSETLLGLRIATEKEIWHKHDTGVMSHHIWAPEMHFLEGKWYIYFAAGEHENIWKIRPFVLRCKGADPMNDEWEEMGMIQCADTDIYSFRGFSLDSTILHHKGELYYIWAEKVASGVGISNLYIAKMESPLKLSTDQVLLTTPDYDWERVAIWVNEGPSVIKHDGKIFVTYSASATGEEYCMGMLSISEDGDLLDPKQWKKERYPVLKSNSDYYKFGPGHNSFTEDEKGRPICVFHARPYSKIEGNPLHDPNRHANLMYVDWNEAGFPVFDYKNLFVFED